MKTKFVIFAMAFAIFISSCVHVGTKEVESNSKNTCTPQDQKIAACDQKNMDFDKMICLCVSF